MQCGVRVVVPVLEARGISFDVPDEDVRVERPTLLTFRSVPPLGTHFMGALEGVIEK